MTYSTPSGLSKKEVRTLLRLLPQQAKSKCFQSFDIEKIKSMDTFQQSITVDGGSLFLSNYGMTIQSDICEVLAKSERYRGLVSMRKIRGIIRKRLELLYNRKNTVYEENYLNSILDDIDATIKQYTFVCEVAGLDFSYECCIDLGFGTLRLFDKELIKDVKPHRLQDIWEDNFVRPITGKLVFLGCAYGEHDVALSKYYDNANLSLSCLRLLACANFKRAFREAHVSIKGRGGFSYQPSSTFGWNKDNGRLISTSSASARREVYFDTEITKGFLAEISLTHLPEILKKEDRTELEETIVKSFYWFGEANSDSSLPSAFLKLWSCLECFFTLRNEEITKRNAIGIASLFLYGDIDMKQEDIAELKDYRSIKKTVSRYYALRSKIAHRGVRIGINDYQVTILAFLTCIIILAATSLARRGYHELASLEREATRLDNIHVG
uniref:HEPN domain-containing protein n=1 Tax=Ningiella ruwaisensis TaxID=2364274 RepID=UPI0010A02EB7|nr:HEPN domain-containing protein [Ningiella ruwaisensis]